MKLYDTFGQSLFEFVPANSPVRIYVCGITPYDSAHLGHVFTFHSYDLLQRRLQDAGLKVRMVRNVTDVDEPIFVRAKQNGESYVELARRETAAFQDVMQQLNLLTPDAEPLASEYIEPMAQAVKGLVDKGFAYKLDNDVYFDITKRAEFLKAIPIPLRVLNGLFADRGGDPERVGKRQSLDFLLWRGIADRNDLAAWDSVVGRGRPGWHIECSVMAAAELGAPIDIHGGGTDLIFPHHACEIAQSESLSGMPFVKHWVHVSPLLLHGEKMSKSLGNLVFARDLLTEASPLAIRLAMLPYHYRAGGEWRHEVWEDAKLQAGRIETALKSDIEGEVNDSVLLDHVRGLLDDNLNTPAIYEAIVRHLDEHGNVADLLQTLHLLGLK